ncbi:MAG: CotH kinase family protein [Planctomycetes bacterium]|nr:CotH kinase family protein [Planctomycetota bacterium]
MLRAAALSLLATSVVAQSPTRDADPAREFFARPGVIDVRIALLAEARQQLRDKPREYAHATLSIDGDDASFVDVGVKLKGAAGSFQQIDEHPGFTVNLGKWGGEARLHGLKRFHLNNCVQDDSHLCEWLGNDIFAAAGYPAPRVSHAHVWLDGQDMGLYVLREGFDKQFLARVFPDAHGNLYDGGFCHDIDEGLEKDEGDGPDDHADLRRLTEVCRAFDPERSAALAGMIDVDAFLDFMALEALVGHWDGYCQNQNNFRLWFDAAPGRTKFLPHGMDQIFDDADRSVLDHPQALVAGAVAQSPEWRKRYRKRLDDLLPLLSPKKLRARLKARAAPLLDDLKKHDRDAAAALDRAVAGLIERVEARYKFLQKHVREPEPSPITFRGDALHKLDKWNAAGETDGITLKKRSYQGATSLHFELDRRGDGERRGAFRTKVLLSRGRYRLCATARCDDLRALDDGGGGASMRVGDAHSAPLLGDQRWTPLELEFEVHEYQRPIELRLEVAGRGGKVWFRSDSLGLVRVGDL